MEAMPVGKRTRLQRAIQEKQIRDKTRQARLEARMRHKQKITEHVISCEDHNDNDDVEEVVQIVDEEEYNRRVKPRTTTTTTAAAAAAATTCPTNVNVLNMSHNEENNNYNQYGLSRNEYDWTKFEGLNGGGEGDDDDSDVSLKYLGARWNPLIFGDYDDIDDDSDDDDVYTEVVTSGGGGGGSGGEEGSQSMEGVDLMSSEDDEDWDKDFEGNSESFESSSSSEEEDEEEEESEEEGGSRENWRGARVVKERKKHRREREGEVGYNERSKRKGRKRKEGVLGERIRVGGDREAGSEANEGKMGRKKKVKKSKEEVFERLVSSIDPSYNGQSGGDDNVGEASGRNKTNSHFGSSCVKLRKGNDGVFRKVARDEPLKSFKEGTPHLESVCDMGRKTGPSMSGLSHSTKIKRADDGVLTKVVSNDDENEKPVKRVARKERAEEEGGDIYDDESTTKKLTEAQCLSKRKRKEKLTEAQNNILETILEEVGNTTVDEGADVDLRDHVHLSLKFRFPEKEVEPEEELESESLFKELEFGLQACQIASDDSAAVGDDMEVDAPECAASGHVLCAGGKHHLIHDEEIGIYCRFCSYIMLESKYVTPDFHAEIFGKAGRREAKRAQSDDRNMIQIPDADEDNHDNPVPQKIIQGTVWELIPETWKTLYPHQREGFEFIWKNVAGGIRIEELDRSSKYGVGGCIICHAPGTGKTRLAIVFIESFLKQYPMSKPVIVAPRTMLRTWQEEFVRWRVEIPFLNLNDDELSGKEDPEVLKQVENYKCKKNIRAAKLSTWVKGKGILGISYGLYEMLAHEKKNSDERIRDALIKMPGLLVLDEGHTPRNDKSNIWRVLSDVLTKRKVILSGTPFQNNFEELSNTLSLVREELEIPMKTGTNLQDERKIEELSNKIRPFVHVHKGEILKETLKGLFSSLIILKPSELQRRCFDAINGQANFAVDNLVSTASVHPSIFCEQKPNFYNSEWAALLESRRDDLDAGVKTRFLVELIQLTQGERVLVFGQFLPPLNFLAGLLKSRFHWEMGRELLYMDGKQDTKERQSTIRFFNDPRSEARVLLASTKACCEGIHLVGASRVVLLDVVWNPSVERQAISRAYRLGQKRDVFVYHLITSGTMEERKYRHQATKERLSELVFSSSEGKCIQKPSAGSQIFVDKALEAMLEHEKTKPMFHKIVYQPKADNLINSFGALNL